MAVLAGRDVQDTVFDIHSARVRERLRQSGILIVNPTDLFDSLPKREDDSWHFRCLSKGDKSYNAVDTTLLSLESLISHVVLITHHLIESSEAINSRGDRSWISCMEAKSARAHLTLAIQYDPREDVLPLSYSRRPDERGSGTMDLQSLTSFGIDLSLLRGRVLKARAQPAAECHFASEVASHESIDRLHDMVFGRRELRIGSANPAEIERREDH